MPAITILAGEELGSDAAGFIGSVGMSQRMAFLAFPFCRTRTKQAGVQSIIALAQPSTSLRFPTCWVGVAASPIQSQYSQLSTPTGPSPPSEHSHKSAAAMSASVPSDEAILKDELATLRIVRATLESVKQLAGAIHQDVETAAKNCRDVTGLHRRWDLAIKQSQGAGADQNIPAVEPQP